MEAPVIDIVIVANPLGLNAAQSLDFVQLLLCGCMLVTNQHIPLVADEEVRVTQASPVWGAAESIEVRYYRLHSLSLV